MQPGKRSSSSFSNCSEPIQVPMMGCTPGLTCVSDEYRSSVTITVLLSTRATSLGSVRHTKLETGCCYRSLDTYPLPVFVFGQRVQHAALDQLVHNLVGLVLGPVADVDAARAHQLNFFGNEALDLFGQDVEVALELSTKLFR